MCDTYNIKTRYKKFINTEQSCVLNNGHSITIPKSIRKALSFMTGDEVTVGLNNLGLIIRKNNRYSLDNKMIISERGKVWIPKELRKSLCLTKGDIFQIYVSNCSQTILLKKILN